MAVLNKEDFLNAIKGRIGEDTSDDALKFLEDMTDTFNHLETASADSTDWKAKYEQNDNEWRQRYTSRFFNQSAESAATPQAPSASTAASPEAQQATAGEGEKGVDPESITFDDLFTEG